MEAAAKRVRTGGGSAPDRLSALSDELLCHVLSFLPSRQAVQTTTLSKRWVDLWLSMPSINLDISDFPDTGRFSFGNFVKLKDFITNLLMLHNAQFLDVIRLGLYIVSCPYYPGPDVDRLVRCLIKHHPLVLDVNVNRSLWLKFQIPLVGSAFCRLKTLKLHGVSLDDGFTERLNSRCPVLEDLVLDYCRNEFTAIQSDTLKNLVVQTCSSQVTSVLVIRVPCLISLSLKFPCIYYRNGLFLKAGNSLARASISVYDDELSKRAQTIILGSLWNVTSLELYGFSALAFLDKELDKFPTFDNLRTLSVDWCFLSERDVHKFKALGRFLQVSPNLERLTLQNFWYSEGIERKSRMYNEPRLKTLTLENRLEPLLLLHNSISAKQPQQNRVKPVVGPIEFPMLENLRALFLDKCDLRDNFRILRHFLRSSPNLEKLTLRCCELPEGANGGKGKANSAKTFRNLVYFQCRKLKSAKIIYKKGDKIQELVSFLLDISEHAPINTVTLTKVL